MPNAILSLTGKENSGKSFVLNQVISRFLQDSRVSKVLRLRDYKDKTYLFYINEKILMITTLGDTNDYIQNEIEFAFQQETKNIDVIVYAQRSLAKKDNFPYIDYLIQNKKYVKVYNLVQFQSIIAAKSVLFGKKFKLVDTLDSNTISSDLDNVEKLSKEILKYT